MRLRYEGVLLKDWTYRILVQKKDGILRMDYNIREGTLKRMLKGYERIGYKECWYFI